MSAYEITVTLKLLQMQTATLYSREGTTVVDSHSAVSNGLDDAELKKSIKISFDFLKHG